MKNKILASALGILLFSLNQDCSVISADENYTFTYIKNNNSITITGGEGTGEILTIPEYIDGLPVTEIAENAFKDTDTFSSLYLPDTLLKIKESSFQNCNNLETVYIGSSVSEIELYAFSACNNLTEINVSNDNYYFASENGSLFNYSKSRLIRYAGKGGKVSLYNTRLEAINDTAFFGTLNITDIEIPDTVAYIGDYAFAGCINLESIDIPKGTYYLGNSCFFSCTNLKKVQLPETLSGINPDTFCVCPELRNIIIPESISEIEKDAFFAHGKNLNIYGFQKSKAQDYAYENNISFYLLGDINKDGTIDASDASDVLADYAYVASGATSNFDESEKIISDINMDGTIDASDASYILALYAKYASGE
ncbi:MAG: leucine-rich repeat protein [Oscillospiraceae bacterium]|nr:leucine-rich repeat protein [Oscillospiraceae bacterium]